MTPSRDQLPELPPRLAGLGDLALNLAWSWHRQARAIFRRIDELTWRESHHNPLLVLQRAGPDRLEALSRDEDFCRHYDQVMSWFGIERSNGDGWFRQTYPALSADRPVAYFCAEFGLHASLPIYSGGLGILAGDHCKTASDLALPLVGVGLFYRKGYFDQRLTEDGWQEDSDDLLDVTQMPVEPVSGPDGHPWLTVLPTFDRPIHIRAWAVNAGRVPIYLLDTDLEENHPEDRELTARLYAGGAALRLRQEWILGVGGVRVLRAIGVTPGAWHANEGHAAFMMLERLRERVLSGIGVDDAIAMGRRETVFTTHTPVPAGHDAFGTSDVRACAGTEYLAAFGPDASRVVALGNHPEHGPDGFEMTVLAIRLAGHVNGVAQRHGAVSREIWRSLWPGRSPDQVPIRAITNGVHLATWMANPMMRLLDRHLGAEWGNHRDSAETWAGVGGIDAAELWQTHRELKLLLLGYLREEARVRWRSQWKSASQVVAAGTLLDPEVFTIGFARRFATYKRADLPFRDLERLRALLTDAKRPVQLIISGKAHPEDQPGKEILKALYHTTRDPQFEGRVAFLEDYDMHLAHLLVQGVDLWLNLPRRPLEASGTSGMKAALNGVPQLSTLDGWWEEGFTGRNGWAIPQADGHTPEEVDAADGRELFRLLEQEVVPRWYARDERGIPADWIGVMREAIRTAGERFTARRMVQDYAREAYVPILSGTTLPDDPPS